MLNDENEFVCDWSKDCGRLATRVLEYYLDAETSLSGDKKGGIFCDAHVVRELADLHSPGTFVLTGGDVSTEACTINELKNYSVEDCVCYASGQNYLIYVRVGKNVDPTLWGFPPQTRGAVFACKADETPVAPVEDL
jgi:hypothetical protein